MLTELPSLVLDTFLRRYVTDQDLRVIHQVSSGWKGLVDSRPIVSARRLALVQQIRQEKENIRDATRVSFF